MVLFSEFQIKSAFIPLLDYEPSAEMVAMATTADQLILHLPSGANKGPATPWIRETFLLTVTLLLLSFSLVMVYSTTGVISQEKFGDPFFYLKRQAAAVILGICFLLAFARVPLELVKKVSPFLFPLSLLLLIATYIPGIGDRAGGAQRWLNLGILRFQPGEFVKVCFVVFMAGFLARHEEKLSTFITGVFKPFLLVGCVCSLFLMQPDFGSSAIICIITMVMSGVAGAQILHLLALGAAFVLPGIALVIASPYRMKRITSYLTPWADPSGSGYQLIQSLIAVGTGKMTGVGLGESQQKLFFLPAAHTDFIFAVIGEELGFLGCMATMLFFLLFLWRGLKIANRVADDTFAFSLSIGLTLIIALPALLNAGVVTGVLPTKGMVLPLIGYGGTSIVASLIAVGLLLSISRTSYTNTR